MGNHWKMYRLYTCITAIYLLLLILSCSKEIPIKPQSKLPQRTILYYLGTDNNLQVEADDKIEALRLGFPGGNNKLVIYKDKQNILPELLEVYVNEAGESRVRVIKTYPEQNSAAGETFQAVLNDVEQFFPANSYGLILFSHATGWLPRGALTRPEATLRQTAILPIRTYTVAVDGGNELDLAAFASAIPDKFFDFIAFEACFMAGVEVLYELKDKTDYILSSSAEIVSPGFLPVYPASLSLLFEPKANLTGFARAYFDFWNNQSGDYRSATVTVTETTNLPDLANWVRRYASSEIPLKELTEIQHFDRYTDHRLFFDFTDYYRRIVAPDAAVELNELLKSIIIYQAATPTFIPSQRGFEITKHSGITTYIPQQRFTKLNAIYHALAWYADTH